MAAAMPGDASVFLGHLNSPFGVALVGNDHRRQYRCDRQISLYRWADEVTAQFGTVRRCRAADQPSLDQEPGREPGRLELCRRRRNSNIAKTAWRPSTTAPPFLEIDRANAAVQCCRRFRNQATLSRR